ncbi:MAG: hydroxyacid dehydrogenase, partial [Deltaproteobacteria bacterium]
MDTILLSELIEESAVKLLEDKARVVVSPDPSDATVGRLLEEADALILRTATRVTREMFQKAKRLKVVSRTGGGLNNVDVDAATDYRVVVCGVKGPQDRYVAEHAVLMMGTLAKHFPYLDGQTRKGNFRSRFEYRPMGLAGKRVGLIGLGR